MKAKRLAAIGAVMALSACVAGNPAVAPTFYYPGYTPSILNYAASQGGMLTEVVGNPFQDGDQERLARGVADVMATSHFGPRLPFFTKAPDDFASPYRVVVVFDPAATVSAYKVCAYGFETASTKDDVVRAHTVLCARDKPLSAASGEVRGAASPEDPDFRRLIGQLALVLFPTRPEPNQNRDAQFFN